MKGRKFLELVALVDRLRGPDGCPWDREQTFDTLKPLLLEEAYETLEALDSGDRSAFRGELGDLLFQVVFLSQMAETEGAFDIDEVADGVVGKMVRRHPHVFGDAKADSAEGVLNQWEDIKRRERAGGSDGRGGEDSILDHLPRLPALLT
ncbi:MAG: MazG family protein, partial [Acidobacteria bacterium]|nr:MazG family protein [Acidobacteriota bacterium]